MSPGLNPQEVSGSAGREARARACRSAPVTGACCRSSVESHGSQFTDGRQVEMFQNEKYITFIFKLSYLTCHKSGFPPYLYLKFLSRRQFCVSVSHLFVYKEKRHLDPAQQQMNVDCEFLLLVLGITFCCSCRLHGSL